LRDLYFEGRIVGLDLSLKMLREARRKTAGHEDQVMLLWKDALTLPFPDHSFEAVCCVEALEFISDPRSGLAEMARVLKPGGPLLAANRIGFDALLMPGRTFSEGELRELLDPLGFTSVEIKTWQTYYDLVWARKAGQLSTSEGNPSFEDVLCCPQCCETPLRAAPSGFRCDRCSLAYPVDKGIICLERPVGK
jgi:ubiquinone/menaquinone biosynthesis C-methylase UbiE